MGQPVVVCHVSAVNWPGGVSAKMNQAKTLANEFGFEHVDTSNDPENQGWQVMTFRQFPHETDERLVEWFEQGLRATEIRTEVRF